MGTNLRYSSQFVILMINKFKKKPIKVYIFEIYTKLPVYPCIVLLYFSKSNSTILGLNAQKYHFFLNSAKHLYHLFAKMYNMTQILIKKSFVSYVYVILRSQSISKTYWGKGSMKFGGTNKVHIHSNITVCGVWK